MSKKTKVWLIVATSLVLIGCAIFATMMTVINWDFRKLSNIEYETNEYEIVDEFSNITIKTSTAEIDLLPTESKKAKVICHEEVNMRHSVTVTDGELTIEVFNTKKWHEYVGINFGTPKITVYLPESEYKALFIKASTGDVNIPDSFKFESILITTSTGVIRNYASASEIIKLEASTGNIVAKSISSKQLELSVSSGKIDICDIDCEGDIKINVSTGESVATNVKCKNLITNGNTGDISLESVIVSKKLNITRSTGDVTLENCDADEIFIQTDTGDVEGTLLSEKVFITETSTGDVDVPKSTDGGKCEIITDTGDIKISVK